MSFKIIQVFTFRLLRNLQPKLYLSAVHAPQITCRKNASFLSSSVSCSSSGETFWPSVSDSMITFRHSHASMSQNGALAYTCGAYNLKHNAARHKSTSRINYLTTQRARRVTSLDFLCLFIFEKTGRFRNRNGGRRALLLRKTG